MVEVMALALYSIIIVFMHCYLLDSKCIPMKFINGMPRDTDTSGLRLTGASAVTRESEAWPGTNEINTAHRLPTSSLALCWYRDAESDTVIAAVGGTAYAHLVC